MSKTFKIIPWLCLLLSSFTEWAVSCFVFNFTFFHRGHMLLGGLWVLSCFLYSPIHRVVKEDLSLSLAPECLLCSRYINKWIFLPHPPGQEGRQWHLSGEYVVGTLIVCLCPCFKLFTIGDSPWMPHTLLRCFSYSGSTSKFSTIIPRMIWLIYGITHCLVTPLVQTFSTDPLLYCYGKIWAILGHS